MINWLSIGLFGIGTIIVVVLFLAGVLWMIDRRDNGY